MPSNNEQFQIDHEEKAKKTIEHRIKFLSQVKTNKGLAHAERMLCKKSIIYFINTWCDTYDPRIEIRHRPFLLWDFQEETLDWLNQRYLNQEVGIIEKSRDMGVTWIASAFILWKWIFESGFSALFGSRKEDLVDDKTIDSIFGKIRYNLYRLPWFLKPNMYVKLNNGNDADSYLKIVNPQNGNEIKGESTNDNFARGGRRSIVFLDEFAHVEHSDKIWQAVRDVADCIIPLSSANGKGNQFAKLRFGGNVPVLTLHWKRHPYKNESWYNARKLDMEPHQLAQELDIDYDASKSGRVYKRFQRHLHVASEIIYPNPYYNEHFITWDFGIADSMAMIFGQIDAEENIEIFSCFDKQDQDIDFFLPLTRGNRPFNDLWVLLSEKDQQEVLELLKKVYTDRSNNEPYYFSWDNYGDFAGTQRTANSRWSVKDRMSKPPYDINLICTSRQDFPNRIQCVDNLLKLRQTKSGEMRSRLKISPDCTRFIDAILNYVWDSEDVDKPNIKPKHNWASHYASAFEFFAINRFPVTTQNESRSLRFR